ncbi:MAG: peptidase S45 penicillin amidase, partial [Chlorobi bacterium OLB7]
RRAGEGRLAEIFGKQLIGQDALLKTIGFKNAAAKTLESLPKETRAALDAYCNGVNAFIASHAGHYPFEFDALGYVPEPWTPQHTVIVTKLLAWELNTSFWTDMVFADIRDRVDSARFSEILPWYPSDAPTIIPRRTKARAVAGTVSPSPSPPTLPAAIPPNSATPPSRASRTPPQFPIC